MSSEHDDKTTQGETFFVFTLESSPTIHWTELLISLKLKDESVDYIISLRASTEIGLNG